MSSPRILIVGPRLGIGGTERHLAQIIPPLAARGLQMHLHVIARGGELEADILAAGVPVTGTAANQSRLAGVTDTVRGVARVISAERPDLVHFFLPEPTLLGSLACEIAGHHRRVASRRSLSLYRRSYPGIGLIENALHRRTLALLANSSAVANELATESGDPAKIGIIRNGVSIPPTIDAEGRQARRAALGIAPEVFAIVVVANLFAYKGHADLLYAVARSAPMLPERWCLVLIGRDAGEGASLDALARQLGIRERLRFVGERRDAADLAAACDVAVLPSHQEGFSNALVEGLARSLPTIATAVGGNLDAIDHERNGLLVPVGASVELADALLRLIREPGLAARLGETARRDAIERFSFGAMIDRYERLYRNHDRLGQVPVSALIQGG